MFVDDAHLATTDVLRALTRRAGAVVAAHRPARREVAELLDAVDGSPVVVGPLRPDELAQVLRRLWQAAPTSTIVDAIHAATGGVPRLAAAVSGHQPITAVRRTAALDELVRSERQRLRPGARGLLDAAAILGDLDLSLLAAAGNLSVQDATAAAAHLAAVGLALDSTGGLVPIVADAVRLLAPASDVTAIAERADGSTGRRWRSHRRRRGTAADRRRRTRHVEMPPCRGAAVPRHRARPRGPLDQGDRSGRHGRG